MEHLQSGKDIRVGDWSAADVEVCVSLCAALVSLEPWRCVSLFALLSSLQNLLYWGRVVSSKDVCIAHMSTENTERCISVFGDRDALVLVGFRGV